jgi:hypothetical protein
MPPMSQYVVEGLRNRGFIGKAPALGRQAAAERGVPMADAVLIPQAASHLSPLAMEHG